MKAKLDAFESIDIAIKILCSKNENISIDDAPIILLAIGAAEYILSHESYNIYTNDEGWDYISKSSS